MRIYFLGGGDVKKRECKEIYKKAFREAGERPKVLMLPWTTTSEEKRERYKKIIKEYFEDLGAEVRFAEAFEPIEEIRRKIRASDVIYLPGGKPEVFMNYARGKRLGELLKGFQGVIVGNSAGALVLCEECLITRDEEYPETVVIPGLGVVNFCVEVHYDPSEDEELKELSKDRKIYAIPERCALVFDGQEFETIGTVYLFHNGKKYVFEPAK
ncbi:MAG TPA: hypothetical protein ENF51_01280 [Candidatus Aenigmarchaeota archaeon]|nr:hypothetical protein [Candidatus Aenigmarchaeota archaeon]